MPLGDLTPEGRGIDSELAPDHIFELLVHVANTTDVEMAITLHVHGQLITGRLISGATFWSECARELREDATGHEELVETMAANMDRVAEEYRESYGEGGIDDAEPMTAFIHLRDARTFTGQVPTPKSGALWRGRLASVDGFTLGELHRS
jgi:hypothetical protein